MQPTPICHLYTAGDQLPELFATYKGVDITGYVITLYLERPTTLLTKLATFVDAAQGRFKFSWAPTDLVAGLSQRGTIVVTDTSPKNTTIAHFMLDVRAVPT